MRPYRNLKIASVIQEELGKLLLREFDFGDVLVTITEVAIGEDLQEAKVKLSILPFEKEPETFILINKRRGELQHKLLKKINIKPMPSIRFQISDVRHRMLNNEE